MSLYILYFFIKEKIITIYSTHTLYLFLFSIIGKYLDDEEYIIKQKGGDEKKLREFLGREKITVRHARGIIVGCGGAGKTTLLRRLANANFNDLQKIKSTVLVDVHVNKFVLTEEGTMIPSNFVFSYV